jgi:hypothetical protein
MGDEGTTDVQLPLILDFDISGGGLTYPGSQAEPVPTVDSGTRASTVLTLGIKGNGKIQTSGSSTTVTALNTQAPFTALVVGDLILVTTVGNRVPDTRDAIEGGQTVWLRVAAKASANSITVNRAVDLTGGVSFLWRRSFTSTTAGVGWVPVRGFDSFKFDVRIAALQTLAGEGPTGLAVRVECRDDIPGQDTGSPTVVWPPHSDSGAPDANSQCGGTAVLGAAVPSSCVFPDGTAGLTVTTGALNAHGWFECRVGLDLEGGDDIGATPDSIDVWFVGSKGGRGSK